MGGLSRAVLALTIAASLCAPTASFSAAPLGVARAAGAPAALHRLPRQAQRRACRVRGAAGARGIRASSEEDVDLEAFRDLLNDSWATQTASSEDGVRMRLWVRYASVIMLRMPPDQSLAVLCVRALCRRGRCCDQIIRRICDRAGSRTRGLTVLRAQEFDGYKFRDLIVAQWGAAYDVQIKREMFLGKPMVRRWRA